MSTKKILKEISDYLAEKGVKAEDLKKRMEALKGESAGELSSQLKRVKEFDEIRKGSTKHYEDMKSNKRGENIMAPKSKTAEFQEHLEVIKKLKGKQLIAAAKAGEFNGVEFKSFPIENQIPLKDKIRLVAYSVQKAMGLGGEKADANRAAIVDKEPAATEEKKAITKEGPKGKEMDLRTPTPLSIAKDQLKSEKEKSKVIIDNLRTKHKEDLSKAAEKLKIEKERAKTVREAYISKAKEDLAKAKDKAAEGLSKLQLRAGKDLAKAQGSLSDLKSKLALSIANEKGLIQQIRELTVAERDLTKRGISLAKINEKLKGDLHKGIKFLEKLIQ